MQLIDTVPIPVCHPKRARQRAIFLDDPILQPSYGYCPSKDWHYFGLKGGLRISSLGKIVAAPLLPASPHDKNLLGSLLPDVPASTTIYGDKGFIDLDEQVKLTEDWGHLCQNSPSSARYMIDRPFGSIRWAIVSDD
ncbi:hypothetical protein CSA56_05115 [candidate division KSB3 bacterium]|uniref:Transposase DDE domain-containing protein n=1 Tax=candidate division KSB3 bacterium TaxID=2044937 RepID=A0A2G6KHR2_9BACT|nr:MAG: hypothetical protein CSA56_05115 [candidate division KSB3 bacterium]